MPLALLPPRKRAAGSSANNGHGQEPRVKRAKLDTDVWSRLTFRKAGGHAAGGQIQAVPEGADSAATTGGVKVAFVHA